MSRKRSRKRLIENGFFGSRRISGDISDRDIREVGELCECMREK